MKRLKLNNHGHGSIEDITKKKQKLDMLPKTDSQSENSIICIVEYKPADTERKRIQLLVRPSYLLSALYDDIRRNIDILSNFKLILKVVSETTENQFLLVRNTNRTLEEAGINFQDKVRQTIIVVPASNNDDMNEFDYDDDVRLTMHSEKDCYQYSSSSSFKSKTCENDSLKKRDLTWKLDQEMDAKITSKPWTTTNRQKIREDELALGASASPVEQNHSLKYNLSKYESTNFQSNFGYVGLVNQAMTCYLNSLLQALFMTPEFRNALYDWAFDGEGESKSIPYQLQKLFLNLQTSSRIAVETTDLTQSFGWDSSEAWQQHDIQELCRILFDALEQKFKGTKHADLIKRLYEGKMMDYVKCLECSIEKSREDAFLDIPLPVRPFGSQTAYGSVEEAIRAFVQPETLDGNNQYFCEKCNKKCDAHKGLKFTKFPYILTLHLKRFDFDYQTLHRIKLNDKVTFPQTLNLNSFVSDLDSNGFMQPKPNFSGSTTSEHGSIESAIKFDDCSTTDSGSALEEETSNGPSFATGCNNNEPDLQEDDEGIDMASSTTDNKCNTSNESGPYIYELFAIMIHSGSASGGHYYAYIRDFENDDWFCFNDQTVSSVCQEDIEKSFGGGTSKTFYSSAYSTSTNAYMLMYRQSDPIRNVSAKKSTEFPEHIVNLLNRLKEKEETDRKNKAQEDNQIKLKTFFWNSKTQRMMDAKIYTTFDSTLNDLLEEAHSRLKVSAFAPINRCRLVAYNNYNEKIVQSFDGQEDELLSKLLLKLEPMEMLLETRDENEPFELIPLGSEMIQVYTVDIETGDVDGPVLMRILVKKRVSDLKALISEKLNIQLDCLNVALLKCDGVATLFNCDTNSLELEDVKNKSKIFVTSCPADNFVSKIFTKIVERFEHIITLHFVLPNTDKETLEKMGIPSYEKNKTPKCVTPTRVTTPTLDNAVLPLIVNNYQESSDVVDAMLMKKPAAFSPSATQEWRMGRCSDISSTQPNLLQQGPNELESNSEDSSLSDGDKTLVESPPDLKYVSSTNNSPSCSEAHLSSPEDHTVPANFDYDEHTEARKARNYYFKAVFYEQPNSEHQSETQKMLKVLVDSSMIMGNLKSHLEPHVRVPKEYFKIFRSQSKTGETECTRLTEALNSFKDNERLIIELGRALRQGEYKCKVYYFKLSEISDDLEKMPFLCDWILCKGANVGQTKREIIANLQTLDPIKYDISYDQCRLRMKMTKQISDIYADDDKFGDDIRLTENFEMILQIIEDPTTTNVSYTDVLVFIRRWHPSKMVIDSFQEIIINDNNDLKTVLSKVSGIPEEQIEYARVKRQYIHGSITILNVHTALTWTSNSTSGMMSSIHTGDVFFYKDKEEPLKQLTPAERNELSSEDHLIYKSSYINPSPRRERSLKIYLDSPKKRDE